MNINSKSFKCGYCGQSLASNKGYFASQPNGLQEFIYICHYCDNPTFFSYKLQQYPGPQYGSSVIDIPSQEVKGIYDEARNCMSVNSYTAAVLCCRKLLMSIGVSKGAEAGLSFARYVDFLCDKGLAAFSFFVPDAFCLLGFIIFSLKIL